MPLRKPRRATRTLRGERASGGAGAGPGSGEGDAPPAIDWAVIGSQFVNEDHDNLEQTFRRRQVDGCAQVVVALVHIEAVLADERS